MKGSWRRAAGNVGATLGKAVDVLGALATRRSMRHDLAARLALPPGCHGLWFDRSGVAAASRSARLAFGQAAATGAPAGLLAEPFGGLGGALGTALSRLIERGSAFRLRAVARDGRVWEVTGAPKGALCMVMLRDASADAAAEAAAARDLAAARAEAEALRLALSAAPIRAWRIDAEGRETWRSPAAEGAAKPVDGASFAIADGGSLVVDPRAAGDDGEASQALRRFIETVSDTFSNLRVGLAIFGTDRRLVLSNPALADLFHVDPRWLGGRPSLRETLDRLREARQLPEQADYPAWRAGLFTLFDNPDRAAYEARWELPDGRAIQVTGRPHPRGGIAFVFEDVSAAVSLQREASVAREVQRTALEFVRDGVALFGLDGRARMTNAAFHAIWRLPRCEGGAPHVSEVAEACRPGTGPGGVWERIRGAVAGGEGRTPWSQRVELLDGRALEVRATPLRDGATLVAFTELRGGPPAPAGLSEGPAPFGAAPRTVRGGGR